MAKAEAFAEELVEMIERGERQNAVAEHPEVVATLRSTYDQWPSEVQPLLVNEVVTRFTTLMKKYIANGRSTVGTPQKNEAAMSVEGMGGKRRRARKRKMNDERAAVKRPPAK